MVASGAPVASVAAVAWVDGVSVALGTGSVVAAAGVAVLAMTTVTVGRTLLRKFKLHAVSVMAAVITPTKPACRIEFRRVCGT